MRGDSMYKALMDIHDYSNGVHISAGDIFDNAEFGSIWASEGLCEKMKDNTTEDADKPKRRNKAQKTAI